MHILMSKKNWRGKEERGISSRIQVPGFRVREAGCRIQGIRKKKQEARSGERAPEKREQGTGIKVSGGRIQGTGCRVQVTGKKKQEGREEVTGSKVQEVNSRERPTKIGEQQQVPEDRIQGIKDRIKVTGPRMQVTGRKQEGREEVPGGKTQGISRM